VDVGNGHQEGDKVGIDGRYLWPGAECLPGADAAVGGMGHHFGVGIAPHAMPFFNEHFFYDGKVLALEKGFKPKDCVFLDMEIFRPTIRSVGQHMVMYDKKQIPSNWGNFIRCIAANNLRGFDFKNDFKSKYPLGTIHLLLAILGRKHHITIPKSAVSPLLYTDGTFKNQFNYPENVLSWLSFLCSDEQKSPLKSVFLDPHYSTYELMCALKELFEELNGIGGGKRGGDKIKISDSKGHVVNIENGSGHLIEATRNQAENLLQMLAGKTGWDYAPAHWTWGPYNISQLKKGSTKPGKARYNTLLAENPVSLAIISGLSIEYTLDPNKVF